MATTFDSYLVTSATPSLRPSLVSSSIQPTFSQSPCKLKVVGVGMTFPLVSVESTSEAPDWKMTMRINQGNINCWVKFERDHQQTTTVIIPWPWQ